MEEYIVSARKYRPTTFDTVVGQQALTTTLKNAVKSGKLAHAYLFCGPRGVGKTTCAVAFYLTQIRIVAVPHILPLAYPNAERQQQTENHVPFHILLI